LHDTSKWALGIGLPAVIAATALIVYASGERITRQVIGATLMILTALSIHQTAGTSEAHFGIFALPAFCRATTTGPRSSGPRPSSRRIT
jgi:methyl-accepting chemotaxis protein